MQIVRVSVSDRPQIVGERPDATYASLDDADVRALARTDPQGFVEGRPGLFVIDEIQRAPELLLAIKASVDRQPRPGRFLITGSSQLSANRAVSETLAGRIERHTLWPLSQGEIERRPETFLSRLLDADLATDWISELGKRSYLERALAGGYPEARAREGRRRRAWFSAYAQTVIEREAPGISASPRTADLPRLLRLIAARHAGVLNISDLAADAQLPRTSVLRYLDTLEALFLIVRIPAWAANLSQREIRAPKVYLTDPGLAGYLRRADVAALLRPELARGADGPIIEGFVLTELLRQTSSAPDPPELAHYRDRDATEINIIVESPDGRVAAIEVQAAPVPHPRRCATWSRCATGSARASSPVSCCTADRRAPSSATGSSASRSAHCGRDECPWLRCPCPPGGSRVGGEVSLLGGVRPAAGSCVSRRPAGVWGVAELRCGYR